MKSYYFRNVLNQITKKRLESFILFVIIFFMTFSLSLLHFFGYNKSIESNIGNNLDLSYEIVNNHILTKSHGLELNKAGNQLEYFNQFIDFIEKIGKHEDLEYFNYNIYHNFYGVTQDLTMFDYSSFGVSNENYLINNKIELKDGRFFTQEEIDQGVHKIVVSDQEKIYRNGKLVDIEVGEKINLQYYDHVIGEFEIIGIYKSEDINFYFAQNDAFVNSNRALISNVFIREFMNEHPEFVDFDNVYINRIQYAVKEYDHYIPFKSYLEDEIKEYDKEMTKIEEPTSFMTIKQNNDSSILASVSRIKGIYLVVFVGVFIIVAIVLLFNIYYILKKKTNEIGICYSLGESKLRIISRYILAYMLLALIAIVLGIIVGYYFSILLTDSMLNESIELQASLSRFKKDFTLGEIDSYTPEYLFTLQSSLLVALEVIFIVFISVVGSMILILKSKLFTRNGGWNA